MKVNYINLFFLDEFSENSSFLTVPPVVSCKRRHIKYHRFLNKNIFFMIFLIAKE